MLSLSSNPSSQSSSPSQIQCLDIHFSVEHANWFQEQEASKKYTRRFVSGAKEKMNLQRRSQERSDSEESLLQTSLKPVIPNKRSHFLFSMLLLLNRFSCVRLCATPQTAAHQAPPSLGSSRQEHWSGLPFPSPMHESEK